MLETIHGLGHGKTIELAQEVNIPEGQEVEVTIRILPSSAKTEPWGEGLRRCAGSLAGIPGLDEDMVMILRARRCLGNTPKGVVP